MRQCLSSVRRFFVGEHGFTMVEYGLTMALVATVNATFLAIAGAEKVPLDSTLILPVLVVFAAALVAAWTDLQKHMVHNWLTIPLFATGLIYNVVAGGFGGLVVSILGVLVAGLPLLALYTRGGMGAGDVKLMAGVGAWLGPWVALHVLLFTGFAVGCYAAGRALWRRFETQPAAAAVAGGAPVPAAPGFPDGDSLSGYVRNSRRLIPFGAMLVPGVACALLWIVRLSS